MAESDRVARMASYKRFCSLPKGHDNWTFESFEAYHPSLVKARDAALELAEDTGKLKWLTLVGGVDRGKSHIAVAVCRRWMERGQLARYGYVVDLLDELKSTFDDSEEWTFKRMFDAICNVPLLVLDELGVEKPTAWAAEKLNAIINHRYLEGLPLMVTTNLTMLELADRVDARISSRLQRFEPGQILVINSPEYRLRRKQ